MAEEENEVLNAQFNEKFNFGGGSSDAPSGGRLGTSVDQDGKSNVWAVEPKMQVEVSEEGAGLKQTLLFGVGAGVVAAIVATVVTSLPNPDFQ